jgi:hypothetical protein
MSEQKPWDLWEVILEETDSKWVRWEDYARLKAEVERLTKAGDAMVEAMWYGDNGRSIWVKKFAETDWNAAKEGKPRA